MADDDVADEDDARDRREEKRPRDRRADDDRIQRGDKRPPPRRSTEDIEDE
jgi:hypothetical protein